VEIEASANHENLLLFRCISLERTNRALSSELLTQRQAKLGKGEFKMS